ncbi:hypothetical protein [Actinomycetospora sp. TBRC 11914]|uniref:hypothetical protein n=1 Tax=Actinomycetospora sp. TBRC 11914 TaxID=2729387 RepID=UPI00145CC377|nr:hypothetical protein [Actinomycetospora sp. TBRC 11914]NMO93552.1 hypothetical protein [Actinomycetospora sp. TBRC 11914]
MAATEREIKDIWTNVCLVTHLAQVIPPPGAILQAPLVGTITLDSVPARFSVKLRPGQLPIDFAKRTARFAAAFGVPAVEVATLTQDNQWISIRLMEPVWIEWPDEYVLDTAALDEPVPPLAATVAGDDGRLPAGATSAAPGRHRATEPGAAPSTEPRPTTPLGSVLRFLGDFWRLPDASTTP